MPFNLIHGFAPVRTSIPSQHRPIIPTIPALGRHGRSDEVSIVLPRQPPETLYEDHQEEDTDDGSGERALGLVVPCFG